MLPVLWIASGIVVVTAAIRSKRHPPALRMGRLGVGFLYIVAGAAANAWMLARGDDYAEFAKGSYLPFVRDTWESLVVPSHALWIGLLIVFEVAVGVLSLAGARRTQLAYALAIAFHVCLLSFGWGFFLWSVPMVAALTTLLRAERRTDSTPVNAAELARTSGKSELPVHPADMPGSAAGSAPPVPPGPLVRRSVGGAAGIERSPSPAVAATAPPAELP